MVWLIIKNNKIDNAIAYDGVSPFNLQEGETLVEYNGQYDLGWGWENDAPVLPPAEEPTANT